MHYLSHRKRREDDIIKFLTPVRIIIKKTRDRYYDELETLGNCWWGIRNWYSHYGNNGMERVLKIKT